MGAARSRANCRGRRPRRPRRPAEACADVLPRVTTRGDSRCRQHPRRGQDPSLRTEPLTGAHATPRAGHARPLPCGGPGTGVRVNPAGVSISPSVGRGAPTPPRPPAAANNSPCLPPWGKVAPQGRMRGRPPLPPIPGQTVGGGVPDAPRRLAPTPREGLQPLPSPLGEGGPAGPDEGQAPVAARSRARRRGRRPLRPAKPCAAANNNLCLPPWGKVAPQGRMRGRLPLPPIPGQAVGGGVPDAPRNLPPTAVPRVTTRKHPPTQTCGPGTPGPYRAT